MVLSNLLIQWRRVKKEGKRNRRVKAKYIRSIRERIWIRSEVKRSDKVNPPGRQHRVSLFQLSFHSQARSRDDTASLNTKLPLLCSPNTLTNTGIPASALAPPNLSIHGGEQHTERRATKADKSGYSIDNAKSVRSQPVQRRWRSRRWTWWCSSSPTWHWSSNQYYPQNQTYSREHIFTCSQAWRSRSQHLISSPCNRSTAEPNSTSCLQNLIRTTL